MLKFALSALSPSGNAGKLSTFIFHRVVPNKDELAPEEPDAAEFARIVEWITAWFNVLPLDGAVKRLQEGTLPARAATITFDDGYEDNFSIALPILKQFGVPATFFIATGFLDGGRMWNDTIIEAIRGCRTRVLDLTDIGLGEHTVDTPAARITAISALIGKVKYLPPDERVQVTEAIAFAAKVIPPQNLMMTSKQVVAMRQSGMQIGAHTMSHPILANLSLDEARAEMRGSKSYLESLLGEAVSLFAYPNGRPGIDYRHEHARLAQEIGFEAAVATAWGVASRKSDRFQLPRFTPWDRSRIAFGGRLLRNFI